VARRSDTVVIQSHRLPLPFDWLEPCLESVRNWAAVRGYDYRFEDDAIFERLDQDLREKTSDQLVIASDLARLEALQGALDQGYQCAVWMDADMLVFDPDRLHLAADGYALGREVWVQRSAPGRVRAYVKVHNAFLQFRAGNPFLAFYRHAAARIVRAHEPGRMVPQIVGPKLLTALHNVIGCPVVEEAAMLSPAVAEDLLAGGGAALSEFCATSRHRAAAVNLCGSLVDRDLPAAKVGALADRLLAHGVPWT
jgi:hypothetical protein